jgi:hypothetical protein
VSSFYSELWVYWFCFHSLCFHLAPDTFLTLEATNTPSKKRRLPRRSASSRRRRGSTWSVRSDRLHHWMMMTMWTLRMRARTRWSSRTSLTFHNDSMLGRVVLIARRVPQTKEAPLGSAQLRHRRGGRVQNAPMPLLMAVKALCLWLLSTLGGAGGPCPRGGC